MLFLLTSLVTSPPPCNLLVVKIISEDIRVYIQLGFPCSASGEFALVLAMNEGELFLGYGVEPSNEIWYDASAWNKGYSGI